MIRNHWQFSASQINFDYKRTEKIRLSYDKLIIAIIFILDISVCTFLIKYYGNSVMNSVFFDEKITHTKSSKNRFHQRKVP